MGITAKVKKRRELQDSQRQPLAAIAATEGLPRARNKKAIQLDK
jgi:hypothetical protein